MKLFTKNIIILVFVALLAFFPLYIARDAEFAGADAQASDAISEFNADYTPWFESFWEPPSGEVESFLFALQAALGSGFVFYYLGYSKGRYNADHQSLQSRD